MGDLVRLRRMLTALLAASVSGALGAQTVAPSAPAEFAGCYRLALGKWSHPLGRNEAYHALPSSIRLDTVAGERGGWKVSPDIAYPTRSSMRWMPRWAMRGDTAAVVWSTGFQVTSMNLTTSGRTELRGVATVGSDANEFREGVPVAEVVATRIACPPATP